MEQSWWLFSAQRSLGNGNQLQPIISSHQRNKLIMCQLIFRHTWVEVCLKNYSSLPALALITEQAFRGKISWFEDAKEALRTPFAAADTNTQHRWIQITASLELH